MLQSYFSGFLTGFLMCISFGTVFFALIQNSVDNGYWSGVKISLGGILSDIIFILVALFGAALLPEIPSFDMILRGIGAFFLIALGITSWIKTSPKLVYPSTKVGDFFYYLGLGFVLNTINPVNFFIWATAAAAIKSYSSLNTFLFFFGSLTAVFLTQFIICYYANRLQKHFTPRLIIIINRIAGTVFLGTGLYLASIVFKFLIQK
jgi:threonine/homoserine/homoserine lactone efflux protein